MVDCERKAMSLAAIVAALFVAVAPGYVSGDAYAVERAATTEGADPADIRIAEGKFSGKFNNRPLFEVLDAIRSKSGIQYQGGKRHLRHPVSGTFKGVPLVDAVKKILEPFNYVMVFNANGEIKRLHIGSLRHVVEDRDAAVARDSPHTTSLDDDLADAATELELEHPAEFVSAESETGPNDPDAGLQSLPEFEPAESETGPNDPDVRLQDLPEFVPVVSETDPNDPDVRLQDQPEFVPVASETDPNDPDAGLQGLPEFDPNVNN